ncbi:MAG: hypothetical protein JSW34_02375 [Candidatus Zixiibacteriota bacterium]|nr:MAG: hypothetical protein JSW34_02375 [candidate division Zixibacteria bacterium]
MAAKSKKNAADSDNETGWPYGPRNYIALAAALVVIIVGFITLGQGSITLAPVLLVLGYCVLLPVALIIKGKPEEDNSPPSDRS